MFPDIKLFVSGSGSFDVKVPVAKYLVGRALIFDLYPLTFEEFIEWKAKDLRSFHSEFRKTIEAFLDGKKEKIEPVFENEFKMLLEEYIIYGGFPAVVKEQDKEVKIQLLKALQQTYLEKDVFFFFDIRHLEKFRDIMSFLSFNIGNLLEPYTLSSSLSMDIRTLWHYIAVLEKTYIIKLVRPFLIMFQKRLEKEGKFIFMTPA